MPYRDLNNESVRYAPAPSAVSAQGVSTNYDSDFEPLITSTPPNELDEYSIMHFTATGRPMPGFKKDNLMYMGADMYSLPQLLPRRYTDDSIIPAIVTNVIPSVKVNTLGTGDGEAKGRRKSFMAKLKGDKKEKREESGKGLVKVVYMPRREYTKFFARDLKGEYIGSEPYRQWTEGELEAAFKQYKPQEKKQKGYRPPF